MLKSRGLLPLGMLAEHAAEWDLDCLLRVDLHVEERGFVRQAAGFDFDVEGI